MFGSTTTLSKVSTGSLTLGDSNNTVSAWVRTIGAHLDCPLQMWKQLASTCKSVQSHRYQISKIRKYLIEKQVKSVVHAHVTCRIDQNNSLLIGLPKKSLKRLQLIWNASAWLIVGQTNRDHIPPSLIPLHWLLAEQQISSKLLLLTYKSLHAKVPSYLKQHLTYIPCWHLHSSSDNVLCVPTTHYMEGQNRSFGVCAPSEWNRHRVAIRSKTGVDLFKAAL